MRVPANTFYPSPAALRPEWSFGRWRRFSRCRREFSFYYLAARGGWDPELPEVLRELYCLKRLSTIPALVNEILLDIVTGLSAREFRGSPAGYESAFRAAADRHIGRVASDLLLERWRRDPAGAVNLEETFLDGADIDDAIADLRAGLETSGYNLLVRFAAELSARRPVEFIRPGAVPEVDLDGVTVFLPGAPVWRGEGRVRWLDLFPGSAEASRAGFGDELRIYWLFSRYGIDPGLIEVLYFDAASDRIYRRELEEFDFTRVRETVAHQALVMTGWSREAASSGFDVMETRPEEGTECGRCRFRYFCRRRGEAAL